ncbi:MAG: sigma-70 family RNA polymerase sigma factor [Bacteroidota bacterium]
MSTEEVQIIRGCQRGRPASQEALYRRYWSFAMSVCLRYTPTRDDALELAHDGFLRAFRAIDTVDPERPFGPWFRKVLVRCAIDRHRSVRRYHATLAPEAEPPEVAVAPDHVEALEVGEILALLGALPAVQRDVFNLYEVDGYAHDEIAGLLGIAASTSRAHLARAKRRLRDLYHQHIEAAA